MGKQNSTEMPSHLQQRELTVTSTPHWQLCTGCHGLSGQKESTGIFMKGLTQEENITLGAQKRTDIEAPRKIKLSLLPRILQ